jgi:hypothetical protein
VELVRTDSGMVVVEPEGPISTILQNKSCVGGGPDNPAPMLLSVLSQVYISFYHSEQSNPYLSSCEVFIFGMLRVVRFFIGPRVGSGALVDYPDRGIEVHAPRSLRVGL